MVFVLVDKAFAIPFLGVVPFVFDLSIFLIVSFLWILNWVIFYIFKNIKLLTLLLLATITILVITLLYLIWLDDLININLNLRFNIWYIYILVMFIFIIYIMFLYKAKFIYILLLSLLFIPLNVNLLYDTITLKLKYDENFNRLLENEDIEFTSNLTFNNIIISRDFLLYKDWVISECRLWFSYYIHTASMPANMIIWERWDDINIYGWCRDLLSEYYY